jgi:hypothetical protein
MPAEAITLANPIRSLAVGGHISLIGEVCHEPARCSTSCCLVGVA